jgi:hypothetical protein
VQQRFPLPVCLRDRRLPAARCQLPACVHRVEANAGSRPDPQQRWETTDLLALRTSAREPQEGFLGVGRDECAVFGQHVAAAEAATVCQQGTVLTKQ